MMPDSAIQSAAVATMASALSAGRVAQVASATTAYSARSPTSSEDARLARPTGGSPAPRKPMGAELEPSQDAVPASTPMQDFAMISAQMAIAEDMDQCAGKIAQQARLNAALFARLQEKHARNTSLTLFLKQQPLALEPSSILSLLLVDFHLLPNSITQTAETPSIYKTIF